MATWILLLHMFMPLSTGLEAPVAVSADWNPAAAPVVVAEDDDGPRYRGLERMFAKFEAEDVG